MENNNYQVDPNYSYPPIQNQIPSEPETPRIRLASVVFRTFSGLFGGAVGSAIMFVLFLVSDVSSQNLFGAQNDTFNPMLIFAILAIAFLANQAASLISVTLFSFCQREKYPRLSSTLVHVFVLNLIIFLALAILYVIIITFVFPERREEYLIYLLTLHILLSALSSTLIMEIIASYRYGILSVYSISFSVLSAVLILFFLKDALPTFYTLHLILPITWGCIGLVVGIIEMIYWWMYDVYGLDYLNINNQFQGLEESYEEPVTPQTLFPEEEN